MSSTIVSKLFKQSIKTFGRSRYAPAKKDSKPQFDSNLRSLEMILNQMKSRDINLDPKFLDPKTWHDDNQKLAPCLCIDVYLDKLFTMKCYILKQNTIMPLHDHPNMHGFIKVLGGKVKIFTYTETVPNKMKSGKRKNDKKKEAEEPPPIEIKTDESGEKIIYATKISENLYDVRSKISVLTPRKGNIHEIMAMDGPAAFFDLLAPPYNRNRLMRYYSVVKHIEGNLVQLKEIKTPSWFQRDDILYTGPSLT